MKILIGIPSAGQVEPETLKAIYGLDKCGHNVLLDINYGYKVDVERNLLCEEAINDGYDYIMFVDSDVILPSNALKNMLDPEADIVMGAYRSKQWRHAGNMTQLHDFGNTIDYTFDNCITSEILNSAGTERKKIKGGGAGCLLISTNALKRIEKPWFNWHEYPSGDVLSEDLWFCEQAHKADIPIYVDTRVRCGHIIKSTYWA